MSYIKVEYESGASAYGPATVTEIGVEEANTYFLRPGEAYWFDDSCVPLCPGDSVEQGMVGIRRLRPRTAP